MKELHTTVLGLEQGDDEIFSDFATGGEMWTGDGDRERRKQVTFSRPFKEAPNVHVSLSMIDLHSGPNFRAEVTAENIEREGFELVFRTWMDTRVARARLNWLAIGGLAGEDDWDV
ncbi:H-type lectin domain-containing protein [Pseudoprimorskyibacter insulae]|uniref:H-type lectin domain-containing protein n=1 Tax=Pseudoprimorskyibacter insulae TaxID=1695997 RepID=A0A2R8ANC1_9RHOB|nr:H-type lectin domain-containing protein [Pseudoprimorskyibacter insulae]SPF77552.1 hypothetical protein PRI8871_00135 [Pseudoprimorskyibacter insulae]